MRVLPPKEPFPDPPPLPSEAENAFRQYPVHKTSEDFQLRLSASVQQRRRRSPLAKLLSHEVAGLSISGILLAASLGAATAGTGVLTLRSMTIQVAQSPTPGSSGPAPLDPPPPPRWARLYGEAGLKSQMP